MGSIYQVTADRATLVERLILDQGTTSQWLNAASFRSCFCASSQPTNSAWVIEGLLPNNETIQLASYSDGDLFAFTNPRYVTVNAMCGLPIRFIATVVQPENRDCFVVLKS